MDAKAHPETNCFGIWNHFAQNRSLKSFPLSVSLLRKHAARTRHTQELMILWKCAKGRARIVRNDPKHGTKQNPFQRNEMELAQLSWLFRPNRCGCCLNGLSCSLTSGRVATVSQHLQSEVFWLPMLLEEENSLIRIIKHYWTVLYLLTCRLQNSGGLLTFSVIPSRVKTCQDSHRWGCCQYRHRSSCPNISAEIL